MMYDMMPVADYLIRMRDGTIKQINPFTGTEVWTVPGRGHRPLGNDAKPGAPLDPAKDGAHCAFCQGRVFETPPEKARLVHTAAGWETQKWLSADQLADPDGRSGGCRICSRSFPANTGRGITVTCCRRCCSRARMATSPASGAAATCSTSSTCG